MTSSIKGHWPRGKRRHSDDGVRALIARTKRLFRHVVPGKTSAKALARAIGVSDRTVHRWLRSEDVPSEANRAAWSKWLEKHDSQAGA